MEEQAKYAILLAATFLCARTSAPPRGFAQSLARLNGLPDVRALLKLNWNSAPG